MKKIVFFILLIFITTYLFTLNYCNSANYKLDLKLSTFNYDRISWSPDSSKVALITIENNMYHLYVIDVKGNVRLINSYYEPMSTTVKWIDKETIVYSNDNKLELYNVITDNSVVHDIIVWDFDYYNNIIYYTKNPGLYKYNLKTRESICINDDAEFDIVCSQNGKKLYYSKEGFGGSDILNLFMYDTISKKVSVINDYNHVLLLYVNKNNRFAYAKEQEFVKDKLKYKHKSNYIKINLNTGETEKININKNILKIKDYEVNEEIGIKLPLYTSGYPVDSGVLLSPDRKKALYSKDGIVKIVDIQE
ncbi:MAG: hypothetical protein ACOC1K_07565 [Nanoarchaeota archaeon]